MILLHPHYFQLKSVKSLWLKWWNIVFHLVFHMVKPPSPTYHINMPVFAPRRIRCGRLQRQDFGRRSRCTGQSDQGTDRNWSMEQLFPTKIVEQFLWDKFAINAKTFWSGFNISSREFMAVFNQWSGWLFALANDTGDEWFGVLTV